MKYLLFNSFAWILQKEIYEICPAEFSESKDEDGEPCLKIEFTTGITVLLKFSYIEANYLIAAKYLTGSHLMVAINGLVSYVFLEYLDWEDEK